jgi:uncharacterized protein
MLFAVHALDTADGLQNRLAHHAAHRAFLPTAADYGVTLVISGPLVADDGETMIGSLMLIEAADRAAVERFNRADPFAKAGVWAQVTITRFLRRQG